MTNNLYVIEKNLLNDGHAFNVTDRPFGFTANNKDEADRLAYGWARSHGIDARDVRASSPTEDERHYENFIHNEWL